MPTISAPCAVMVILAAGDLVGAVVHDHDAQVLLRPRGHRSQRAELHQDRAVALQRKHLAARLGDRHAEGDRHRQAHAAQHVEVLLPAAVRHSDAAQRSKLV